MVKSFHSTSPLKLLRAIRYEYGYDYKVIRYKKHKSYMKNGSKHYSALVKGAKWENLQLMSYYLRELSELNY